VSDLGLVTAGGKGTFPKGKSQYIANLGSGLGSLCTGDGTFSSLPGLRDDSFADLA
jgi:hypothetical protein